jgi:hypothetical protein
VPWSTAEYVTGMQVRAATSQGYAEEFGPVLPEYGPHAAVDGDPATEYRSGTLQPPDEQWLEADLATPVVGGGTLGVQFEHRPQAARVARARVLVETDAGTSSAVYGVPASGLLLAPLPEEPVERVRVSVVEAVGPEADYGRVVISELALPGPAPGRTTVVPGALRRDDPLVLRLDPPRRACVDLGLGPHCDESQARPGQDDGRLDRTVEVAEAGEWNVAGTVVAVPGPGSAALLAPVDGSATARAGSVLAGDPAVSGSFALDGNPDTPWLTASSAQRATLRITWPGRQRVIRTLSIARPAGDVVAPATALIRSGGVERLVDLGFSKQVEPFVARGGLRIVFERPEGAGTTGRPMGVGEVEIGGLERLAGSPDWAARTGALCGLGPRVRVDGVVHDTEVVGTLDDVRLGRPLAWSVCDGPIELAEGSHRIQVDSTQQFQPVTLAWRPVAGASRADPASDRSMVVGRWDPTRRTVEVGPGGEAVLRVAENLNEGWEATLHGERLDEVTIDGWQQGYRVPAGDGGEVSLTYRPDTTYRAGLLVGSGLAVLLVLGAAAGQLRDRRHPRRDRATSLDLAQPEAVGRGGRFATGAALLVLGGPVAGAAYAVATLRRVRGRVWPVGALLVAASAVLAATSDTTRFGSPGLAANLAAAAGAGLLLGSGQVTGPLAQRRERLPVRARWSRLRGWTARHVVLLVGLVLVAGQAVLRTIVASGSYYWQDDFLHLDLAETMGLDQDFLVRDYSGHLEIGSYAVFWLVHTLDTASFVPAVVVLVALQLAASCLLLVLLQQLFGRTPWVLVPFAAYLFTPLGLATATWLAAGLQAFPLQIAMLGALIGLVRFVRSGRLRWAVVSWVAFAVGLLFWQKAALVLPVLVGVEVLVLAAGEPVRERLRRLRRRWCFWLGHLVLLLSYVGLYLAVTASGGMGEPLERGVGETLREMLFAMLLPGLFGGPWNTAGAGNTVYPDTSTALQVGFVVLALAVVAASIARRGRAAIAGWLLVVGYLAADVALVLLGRGAYLDLVARDPRYLTDGLPVIVIGVCAAFSASQRRTGWSGAGDAGRWRRRERAAALVAAGALTASALVTTVQLAPLTEHRRSEDYVRTVTAETEPGAAILSSPVPEDVSLQVSLESLLRSIGREQRLDRPGSVPMLVDLFGQLRPAGLVYPDLDRAGPVADCGWRVGTRPTSLVHLPDLGDERRLLRLGYVAGSRGVLTVSVGGAEQAVEHGPGIGEVYVVVTGRSGPVVARATRPGLCVSEVQRGAPWPVD